MKLMGNLRRARRSAERKTLAEMQVHIPDMTQIIPTASPELLRDGMIYDAAIRDVFGPSSSAGSKIGLAALMERAIRR
jgi:hypothetical protein